ncbi:two component transcriptional regulator, LuxR family [Variovorax sp. HW608]|uniref:response regulator transcription factor n=1 Tax=Variovorax sp. HW608 TaxID=1034889 RepID=UPI00082002B7|nr:response regulator [Variovorax sp. HW608]SCK43803.1 two component transcriptional regulator, LuxR family [Variovorax sp. HW608]
MDDPNLNPAEELPVVRLIDDDVSFRRAVRRLLLAAGHRVTEYSSVGAMLLEGIGSAPGCLVLDIHMPGPSGLDLQEMIATQPEPLPVIFVTAEATVQETLRAMKAGAADFLFKPVDGDTLVSVVNKAVAEDAARRKARRHLAELQNRYARLSPRERQVLDMVVNGALNKQISAELGAAERTVKAHRAHVMAKMGVNSLADLVRAVVQLDAPVGA